MDTLALQGWDDSRPDSGSVDPEAGSNDLTRHVDRIGGPTSGALAFSIAAAERTAPELTSRIQDRALAAELAEELFLAIEAVQLEIELGGSDSPLLASWHADVRSVLARIEKATR